MATLSRTTSAKSFAIPPVFSSSQAVQPTLCFPSHHQYFNISFLVRMSIPAYYFTVPSFLPHFLSCCACFFPLAYYFLPSLSFIPSLISSFPSISFSVSFFLPSIFFFFSCVCVYVLFHSYFSSIFSVCNFFYSSFLTFNLFLSM